MYENGCFEILLISPKHPENNFIPRMLLIVIISLFVVICTFYTFRSSYYDPLEENDIYRGLNLMLLLTLGVVFVKCALWGTEDVIERIAHEKNDTDLQCMLLNGTHEHPLFTTYKYVESFSISFILKTLAVFYIIIQELKSPAVNHALQLSNLMHADPRNIKYYLTWIFGLISVICSIVAYTLNHIAVGSPIIKAVFHMVSYMSMIILGYIMIKSIKDPDITPREYENLVIKSPDYTLIWCSFLFGHWMMTSSITAGSVELFGLVTVIWSSVSWNKLSLFIYTATNFLDLMQIWSQLLLAKHLIVVNELHTGNKNRSLVIGSLVLSLINFIEATDALYMMEHIKNTSGPLGWLTDTFPYAITVSITMTGLILFRYRFIGLCFGIFIDDWLCLLFCRWNQNVQLNVDGVNQIIPAIDGFNGNIQHDESVDEVPDNHGDNVPLLQ
jgi:hypothetical protein